MKNKVNCFSPTCLCLCFYGLKCAPIFRYLILTIVLYKKQKALLRRNRLYLDPFGRKFPMVEKYINKFVIFWSLYCGLFSMWMARGYSWRWRRRGGGGDMAFQMLRVGYLCSLLYRKDSLMILRDGINTFFWHINEFFAMRRISICFQKYSNCFCR